MVKEYTNKFGAIGCRDKGTERILKPRGIEAYFSGCLTLTLGKTYKHNPVGKNVCFVDPYHKMAKGRIGKLIYFSTLILKWKPIWNISNKLNKSRSLKNLLKTAAFYRTYSKMFKDEVLTKADYLKHSVLESEFASEEVKLQYAKNILKKYENSSLVVTSRLHAGAPLHRNGHTVDIRPQ